MPGMNALLLGYLMYRSSLVPRVIPAIGLVGGVFIVFRDRTDPRHQREDLGVVPDRTPADLRVGAVARPLHGNQGLQSTSLLMVAAAGRRWAKTALPGGALTSHSSRRRQRVPHDRRPGADCQGPSSRVRSQRLAAAPSPPSVQRRADRPPATRQERSGCCASRRVGRRSGQSRVAIVGYYEDGPNLITLAMNGWEDADPAWWLNLQARPDTVVELPDGPRAVRGRAAEGDERDRLWARWASSATSTTAGLRSVPEEPSSCSSHVRSGGQITFVDLASGSCGEPSSRAAGPQLSISAHRRRICTKAHLGQDLAPLTCDPPQL